MWRKNLTTMIRRDSRHGRLTADLPEQVCRCGAELVMEVGESYSLIKTIIVYYGK